MIDFISEYSNYKNYEEIKEKMEIYPNNSFSIKLSSLGIKTSVNKCANQLEQLIETAKQHNNTILIDAENHEIQERIDKLKEKYRLIRDQKIRERLEALGIKTLDEDDRETLLKKEKNYIAARQLVETSLESFYRSASSLVFQLNKRHLTRDMSIFRCIDRRFETGEIFIKWDESNDDEWLILIYIKDNSPEGKIIIEDKCNHEKYFSDEYQSNEIFKASDKMVDSLTQLLYRERSKNINQSLT